MSPLGGLRRLAWLGAVACLWLPAPADAASRPTSAQAQEYDLKAAFLFNFAQFVEWPADAFASTSTPITIGILGDDPFGGSLDDMVANEIVHDRKLVVRRYRSVDQIESCHILYISQAETRRMDHIATRLGGKSVLTVGDTDDFTARQGIVGFRMAKNRLRLRINSAVAKEARLVISSKLLRQAEIVGAEKRK